MKRVHECNPAFFTEKSCVTRAPSTGLSTVTAVKNEIAAPFTMACGDESPDRLMPCHFENKSMNAMDNDEYAPQDERLNLTQSSLNIISSMKKRLALCEHFKRGDLCSFQRLVDLLSFQEIEGCLPALAATISDVLARYFADSGQNHYLRHYTENEPRQGAKQDSPKSIPSLYLLNTLNRKVWDTLKWQQIDLLNYIIKHPKINHTLFPLETLNLILIYLSCQDETSDSIKSLLEIEEIKLDFSLLVKALTYRILTIPAPADENTADIVADTHLIPGE